MKKKIYNEIVDQIVNIIEDSGQLPWQATWFNRQINGALKTEYRGYNQIFLSYDAFKKKYDFPIWFTFKQVNQLGGRVKKGAKSSSVFLARVWTPQILKSQCKHCKHFENDTGHCRKDNDVWKNKHWDEKVKCEEYDGKKQFFVMRSYRVFNIEETTLNPEEFLPLLKEEQKQEAEVFIEAIQKDGVSINFGGQRACYNHETDTITMPKKEIFFSLGEYYLTFFHEIIHATGHEKRLNRKNKDKSYDAHQNYSYEELVAELGASFLCRKTGMNFDVKNTASYLQGWVKYLQNHKKAIVCASYDAEKAVVYIEKIGGAYD